MLSSYLRLFSSQQSRQFTRPFFSKKPETTKAVRPLRDIHPIVTYDGQGPTNGYFISLLRASEKPAALAQLEGCDYTITHEFPEKFACFSGKFDAKAMQILRTSPYVKHIVERYPSRFWKDEESL